MKSSWAIIVIFCFAASCNQKSPVVALEKMLDRDSLGLSVNLFMDQWHRDAAGADTVYFDKLAPQGIYIGTDATEYWTAEEFREWSKKYFDQGRAWDFRAIERNVYMSDDGTIVWFDELLDTWMGICRSSGVLSDNGDGWQIEHYHLSITIPNELSLEVIDLLDQRQKMSHSLEPDPGGG